MVYTFPTDPTYNGVQTKEADLYVLYPMAIVAACLNTLAVIATYSYQAQRKFPTSVLAWIAIINTLDSFYLVMKWNTDSLTYTALVENLSGGTHLCGLSLFIDNSNFYATVACNLLISLTLFLTFTLHVPLAYEENKKAFWGYVAFFWAWTLAIPLAVATGPTVSTGYKCAASGPFLLLEVIPEFTLIFVSFCLLVIGLYSTAKALRSGEKMGLEQSDAMLKYLLIRFTLTFISQAFSLIPSYTNSLYTYRGLTAPSVLTRMNVVGFPLSRIVDALIILIGNKSLVDTCKSFFYARRNNHNSTTDIRATSGLQDTTDNI